MNNHGKAGKRRGGNGQNSRMTFQMLEPRRLLAGITLENINGVATVLIDGSLENDVAVVANVNDSTILVQLNDQLETFAVADVERIRFVGRNGDDLFTNLTSIDSSAAGNDGHDILTGGNGHNWFQGGNGNDQLLGGDLNDQLRGRAGNDTIDGGKRHDKIFGAEGNDVLIGASGDDVLHGNIGNDQFFAGNGNDQLDGGTGANTVTYSGAHETYRVIGGETLLITDQVGNAGEDTIVNLQSFIFADGTFSASTVLSASERVTVRPIIASNNNGSNTAESFGNAAQETDIKLRIDEIFAQADIDILWESDRTWNNSFANVGNGGTRPPGDLNLIVSNGDSAGVGSNNSAVVDLYFLEITPQFGDTGENVANGFSFISSSGATVHVGDNLVSFAAGRDLIARIIAHEICHNLDLMDSNSPNNLMSLINGNDSLTQSQINQILASNFSLPI